MRILILNNFYPPFELGGQGRSCQQIVEGLRTRGHEVAVLTSMNGIDNTPMETDGIYRWLYLEMDFAPWRQVITFFLHRKERERENLKRFERLLQDLQPDLIFIWSLWNLHYSLAGVAESNYPGRVVYRFAEYWPTLPSQHVLYWQREGRTWFSRLPKVAIGKVAGFLISLDKPRPQLKFERPICVSASTRDALVEAGIPVEHARTIHTGIDAAEFLGGTPESFPVKQADKVRLLYAGRLHPVKGLETAIEAMAILVTRGEKRAHLTLAGSGNEKYVEHLRGLVKRKELREQIKFLGRISPEKIPDLMLKSDVLILTSIWPEPFARVVLEGMCAGMVILATPTGGTKEIVRDGENGLFFEAGDSHNLADAIQRLIESPELRNDLAHTAWRTVRERYSVKRMMDAYESYLLETLKGSELIQQETSGFELV